MYIKKCIYCGKEFKSTQSNTLYCSRYHAYKYKKTKNISTENKDK